MKNCFLHVEVAVECFRCQRPLVVLEVDQSRAQGLKTLRVEWHTCSGPKLKNQGASIDPTGQLPPEVTQLRREP